jgi:FkbM family methyltransferase
LSKTLARCVAGFARLVSLPLRSNRRRAVKATASEYLAQTVPVRTARGDLLFYAPTRRALHYPWKFFDDEPDTLAWIDRFSDRAVFWDVGANIGQFALYAALRPEVCVIAFEPGAASYAVLNRNIEINRMDDRVRAYPIALSDRTTLDTLNMATTEAGSSMHAFGTTIDCFDRDIPVAFRQAAIGMSADDFQRIFAAPLPTHLKIDVDSIEAAIIRGAATILDSPAVESVWVEVLGDETPRGREIAAALARHGYKPQPRLASGSRNLEFRR